MKRLIYVFLSFAFICTNSYTFAQTVNIIGTDSSARATALCPEISKLAEAVILARDIGYEKSQVFDIIHQTINLDTQEAEIIHGLIDYAYMHPELTPYEYSDAVAIECYKQIF